MVWCDSSLQRGVATHICWWHTQTLLLSLTIEAQCAEHGRVHLQGVHQRYGSDFASGLTHRWIGMVTVSVVLTHHPMSIMH